MTLTLIPSAGLCNRINAILSAIAVRNDHPEQKINVYWQCNDECAAYFDQLFLPIPEMEVKRLDASHFWLIPPSGRKTRPLKWLRRLLFDAQLQGINVYETDEALNPQRKRTYIYSANRFCTYRIEEGVGRYFKPIPAIAAKIDSITNQYSASTFGIHIRRTDNNWAIEQSPVEAFTQRIDQELMATPNAKFFLATDDYELKKQLCQTYSDHIITYSSTLNRNTTLGMQDAIVELFCLAHTSRILGSAVSTYSETAARLYDIPLEIITDTKQRI